jgi:hypothetical protein
MIARSTTLKENFCASGTPGRELFIQSRDEVNEPRMPDCILDGGAAGAAVGHEAGGVIGRKLDGDGKPQTNKQVTGAVTVSSTGHSAADQGPCGWKKNKNHPGKGWAKGHSKAC